MHSIFGGDISYLFLTILLQTEFTIKGDVNMKKFLSFILTICIVLSASSISFYAINENNCFTEQTIEFNEWDEYQKISSMSCQQLIELGYTKSEVSEIKNFDYENEIRRRAALDDNTLRLYKYTPSEIKELRAAAAMEKIPASIMKSISTATMTTRLKYISDGSRQESGKTMYYVNLRFFWQWNKMPFFRLFDMIAIAFNSTTANKFTYCAQSNQIIRIRYSAVSANATDYKKTLTWDQDASKIYCISKKFSLENKDLNNLPSHFAYYGYGNFQLTNRSKNARLYVDAAYGHTTVNITPSFSLSFSGSPISGGIDFCAGMDEQHCTGQFYENFTIAKSYIYHGTVYGKNDTGGNAA